MQNFVYSTPILTQDCVKSTIKLTQNILELGLETAKNFFYASSADLTIKQRDESKKE